IKKEKAKSTDTPGEGKNDKSTAPVEAHILMINREDCVAKNTISKSMAYKEDITFPPEQDHAENEDRGLNNSRGHKVSNQKESKPYSRLAKKQRRPEGPLPSAKKGYPAESDNHHGRRKTIQDRAHAEWEGVFCFGKMPFGLKTARATYLRLVDKVLSKQIERNLEAYVDDMVIKSTSEEGMLSDIQETFKRFWSINMKLNPKKCSFGMEDGLFLGQLITKHGIKSNPSKIKAVIELEQPQAVKDIQSLNGKLAALSHFLSKRQKDPFLSLMVLQGAELNYPALEKIILALVHAAKRLRRYFQAHTIMVLIDEREMPADFLPEIPFDDSEKRVKEKEVLDPSNKGNLYTDRASSSDGAGVGLILIDPACKEYTYALRFEFETTNNKAEYEALLAGLRIAQEMEITKVAIFLDSQLVVNQIKGTYANEWKLYTDRASSSDGAGVGLILIDPACKEYTYALRFEFETTNNKAEYEALLARLRIAQEMEITKVAIFLDSQLVVNQIKGTYAAKQLSIKSYLQKVKTTLKGFEGYTVEHVLVKILAKRSIEEKEVLKVEIEEKRSWMIPIQEYLLSGLLPKDENEARKIKIQVPQYKLIRGNLYKRSFFTPWLRCIAPPQTDKIIKEIHEGSCEFNAKPHSMVVRITKQGYYWPSMHMDTAKTIQDYNKCKEQSTIRKAGIDGAIIVESTWPFSHWGIHILRPLPMAPGGL
nr:reverse transcriptase domain-containing protein [Tanacetum cinerariifolium]